jgi:RNA polymerase sigma-70 factor (ECF subfamily)
MAKEFKRFLEYYNTYFEKVYRYIFFRVGRDKELAEDLTSEIFLKALEKFENFDQKRPFAVWIYRIAHNHLIDHYKKQNLEMMDIEELANELKANSNLVNELERKMNASRVTEVLEELPPLQKEVIMMKYLNDLSNPEIAEILDTNEAHVRVLHHRALKWLKTKLAYVTI